MNAAEKATPDVSQHNRQRKEVHRVLFCVTLQHVTRQNDAVYSECEINVKIGLQLKRP
jgi:hypothetical protein